MKNHIPSALTLAVSLVLAQAASAQIQGPSTGSTPYLLPAGPNASLITTTSILTVDNTGANPDDSIGGYGMVGIPDGLGVVDNNPGNPGVGTFTVFMNHELGNTQGVVRAHGSAGAFVSQWTINKSDLQVTAGQDFITSASNVFTWDGASFVSGTTAFNRLCSADLAPSSAFFYAGTGYNGSIFMNGEETSPPFSTDYGRAFAHIVGGTDAGKAYELPSLGKISWENAVANPFGQNKTIVMGLDDDGVTDSVFHMYVGNKTNTGNAVERAGLHGGTTYALTVNGAAGFSELRGVSPDAYTGFGGTGGVGNGTFSMVSQGVVTNMTGIALESQTEVADGISQFRRIEDGVWDKDDSSVFYFVTTDGFSLTNGRSRLWKLDFSDVANPEAGGSISMLLEGTEGGQMFDNMTQDHNGDIILQEDVGNQAHNGKVWRYKIGSDTIELMLQHDPARFAPAALPYNQDEEATGVVDVTSLFTSTPLPGEGYYLMADQAHYTTDITGAQVQGGQLFLVHQVPEPGTAVSLLGGLAMLLGLRRRRA